MSIVPSGGKDPLFPPLSATFGKLIAEFDLIPGERRNNLLLLSEFVRERVSAGRTADLSFICTHNSRRSHMAQLWAQAAAYYYGVKDVQCYSGGMEATAFNPRAVKAMRDAGFRIKRASEGENPAYEVTFSDGAPPLKVFSKRYDDPFNASRDFAAIMTCSQADQDCPLVAGAMKRIAITYQDPKDFDGSAQEMEKYHECARQIGRELLFAFANI